MRAFQSDFAFPPIREYPYLCMTSSRIPQGGGTRCRKKRNKSQCGREVAKEKNHGNSGEMIINPSFE